MTEDANKDEESAIRDVTESLNQKRMESDESGGVRELLRNRDFAVLFSGQTLSDIGSNFTFIAYLFLIISIGKGLNLSEGEITKALALVTMFQLVPTLLFGPFAGVLVDRFDRKKIMLSMDIVGAITSFSLIFATTFTHVYILAASFSLYRIFFFPARTASLPLIVRQDQLLQANGLSSTTFQLSGIIGPALAGLTIKFLGLKTAFFIDGVSYVISFLFILSIRTDLRPKIKDAYLSVAGVMADLKFGIVYVARDKILRFVLVSSFIFILALTAVNPLFPAYLTFTFGLEEDVYGYINTVAAIAGLITAVLITSKGQIDRKLAMIASAMIVAGFSILLVGSAPYLPNPEVWLWVGMAFIGTVNVLLSIPLSTLFQSIVPNEALGKVNSILGWTFSVGQMLAAFIATTLVLNYSISTIFIVLGLITIPVGFITLLINVRGGLDQEVQEREGEMLQIRKQQDLEYQKELFGAPEEREMDFTKSPELQDLSDKIDKLMKDKK